MIKIQFKNEKGSDGEFQKSWGVYFEGQDYKFTTIILAWASDADDDMIDDFYGDDWTTTDTWVLDIIGDGFEKFIDIKNAIREHADELKAKAEPMGY
jgi:hypothetical protein